MLGSIDFDSLTLTNIRAVDTLTNSPSSFRVSLPIRLHSNQIRSLGTKLSFSPFYATDGTIYGASYNTLVVSYDKGTSWQEGIRLGNTNACSGSISNCGQCHILTGRCVKCAAGFTVTRTSRCVLANGAANDNQNGGRTGSNVTTTAAPAATAAVPTTTMTSIVTAEGNLDRESGEVCPYGPMFNFLKFYPNGNPPQGTPHAKDNTTGSAAAELEAFQVQHGGYDCANACISRVDCQSFAVQKQGTNKICQLYSSSTVVTGRPGYRLFPKISAMALKTPRPCRAPRPCSGGAVGNFAAPRANFRSHYNELIRTFSKHDVGSAEECAKRCLNHPFCLSFSYYAGQLTGTAKCLTYQSATPTPKKSQTKYAGWQLYVLSSAKSRQCAATDPVNP